MSISSIFNCKTGQLINEQHDIQDIINSAVHIVKQQILQKQIGNLAIKNLQIIKTILHKSNNQISNNIRQQLSSLIYLYDKKCKQQKQKKQKYYQRQSIYHLTEDDYKSGQEDIWIDQELSSLISLGNEDDVYSNNEEYPCYEEYCL